MAMQPIHGDAQIGQTVRLYNIWRGIRQRCSNPKATNFAEYGGRGIVVDAVWSTYVAFREWALITGYADNLSIERRDVDGNYTPTNCYWANNTTQACNKRKRTGRKSCYIGVAPNKKNWQAYASYKGTRHELGTYQTPEEAAQVRDDFIKQNNWPHKLNFEVCGGS